MTPSRVARLAGHLAEGRIGTISLSTTLDKMAYQETTNPALTGIKGLCPRCQEGHLFSGYMTLARRCGVCGLDFSFADPADGPAFFAMSIVAVPALGFALWLQLAYEPPFWIHLFTTLPLTIGASVLLLRPLKGWLVCSQYFHKAEEGSIDREWHAAEGERRRSKAGEERSHPAQAKKVDADFDTGS